MALQPAQTLTYEFGFRSTLAFHKPSSGQSAKKALAINVSAVANSENDDGDSCVIYCVDDSVVPHPHAIGRSIRELSGGRWKRMGREYFDRPCDACSVRWIERKECSAGFSLDDDRVTNHERPSSRFTSSHGIMSPKRASSKAASSAWSSRASIARSNIVGETITATLCP